MSSTLLRLTLMRGSVQKVVGVMAGQAWEGVILLDTVTGSDNFDSDMLERFGHPVRVCHGPDDGGLCPLLAGTGCEDFNQAHGILFELDLDRPQHRAILRRYRDIARPDVPIRVVTTAEQAARHAADLEGIEVLAGRPTVSDLDGFAAEVEAADRTSR